VIVGRVPSTGRSPQAIYSDPRVIAYFNANDATMPGVVLTGGTNEVQSWPNLGSNGGSWQRGTNAQVAGQGLGPVWSATAMNGAPGITFTAANLTTLKLNIGSQLSNTSGHPGPMAIFANVTCTNSNKGSGQFQAICQCGNTGTNVSGKSKFFMGRNADTAAPGVWNPDADTQDNAAVSELCISDGLSAAYGCNFNQNTVCSVICDSTGTRIRINGLQVAPVLAGLGALTMNLIVLGCRDDANQNIPSTFGYLDGTTIGSLLVVAGTLSNNDIQVFETFVGRAV
jgi:hypothetical protein